MNRSICLFWFSFLLTLQTQAQLPPIGQWREHYNWSRGYKLLDGQNRLWCATDLSLFSIEASDQSITTFGKLNGLSSLGLQEFGWDPTTQTLIAAFEDGSIDLIKENKTQSLPAFKLSDLSNKKIHAIYCKDGEAYVGTEMGILVIDLLKSNIQATYVVGNKGDKKPVWAIQEFNNRLYEIGPDGIKSASIAGPNPSDFRNWSLEPLTSPLQNSNVFLLEFNGGMVAAVNDSLFFLQNNQWKFFYADSQPILDLKVNNKQLLITQKKVGSSNRTLVLDSNGSIVQLLENKSQLPDLQQTVFWKGNYWCADAKRGLTKLEGSNYLNYLPQGPQGSVSGPIENSGGRLWTCSGLQVRSDSSHGIFLFEENKWTSFKPSVQLNYNFLPITSIAYNNATHETWAGSLGSGLLKLDGQFKSSYFSQGSGLEASTITHDKFLVTGLCLDAIQQLWISNSETSRPIKVRKADGKWYSFTPPFPITAFQTGQLLADDYHQIWIQLPGSQGLLVFNYGNSIENPADDRWKWFRSGKGNGNLPDNQVLSLAKDQNGFVWIGTQKGLAVVQCTEDLFGSRGCEAVIPIVQNNSFAGYLLGDEEVNCLTVDGANRIWAGTNHGIWLLSEDGEKTIYRFTAANSPLPSDIIYSLKLDGISGELFIATAMGMVSFRSTATEGNQPLPQLQVFPQPVPPDYKGSIAIRGMKKESVVKITELDGRLVYETRSLGGQALWNGCNYKGERMATGIYQVWVAAIGEDFKMCTKIVFIGK